MADNLPLIPEKETAVCADVRPVLREVFRELDVLPPLAATQLQTTRHGGEGDDNSLPKVDPWMYLYEMHGKEIWQQEGALKQQHAKRISREPLPNIYKLYPRNQTLPNISTWERDQGLLQRRDLMPSIIQNANREDSLWVKNTLNRSSGDLASVEIRGSRMYSPICLSSPKEASYQSLSLGDIESRPPPLPPPPPPPPPLPDDVICVPPELDFVNFTIGKLETKSIRVINVSKSECRLSIRPPARRELDVELCGSRGLTLTSGAAVELNIHFRATDVRVLRDLVLVHVSTGRSLAVPICCYMMPPMLDVLVPAVPSSILSCSPRETLDACPSHNTDIIELGARLLGDVHCVQVMFHSEATHAAFFLLTEDAWLSFCLDALTSHGALEADPFVVQPAWWSGGGAVQARVWCRANSTGLHTAALRILSSTAVVRPLHLLADSLYYRPDHITVEAHPKDYDICSADDLNCEYFVHLGTAFPRRALTASVQLINNSPVVYSYYWSVRPWGVCSCWEEESSLGPEDDGERLCIGPREARDMELEGTVSPSMSENARCICVEPARGRIEPRSSCALQVCAPDVGAALGTQRAVLMLILKNIPKESFQTDYVPMIVKTEEINTDAIPGIKGSTHEVCEVVCAQMEVWWEVAPVRFVLDPPVLPLIHSRRVESVDVLMRATQLFGCDAIHGQWHVPEAMPAPAPAKMTSAQSCTMTIRYPLPALPNEYPETDTITLKAAKKEWMSHCCISRQCATRHPALRPAIVWLGVVPPGVPMKATLKITNDTHQHICWWATPYRWHGENTPSRACVGRAPCESCRERNCSCALLKPSRGALTHGGSTTIYYDVNAPEVDGCVATLAQVQRTAADVSRVALGSGLEGRASLFMYRVLAPRLVLRVLPCAGDKKGACKSCSLDESNLNSDRGTAILRPRTALTLSQPSCYRLRVTNLTPIPTTVTWDSPPEAEALKVLIIPNELQIKSYGEVQFQVVLDGRRVCGRRVYLRCARVRHAYRPLYLIIDAEIAGLEILCEIPIGENIKTDSTLIVRRSQKEEFPGDADKFRARTSVEMFEEEDRKRAARAENCRCHFELVYIPPVKRPRRPPRRPGDYPPIEIVCEPPPMTRVCPCFTATEPILVEHEHAFCLQFKQMPLRTVHSRTVTLRNESTLAARWSSAVRRWPRHHTRTLGKDEWAQDVREPGIVVQCCPREGVLNARATIDVAVQVYADCWGLYHDQVLLRIDNVEPLVLDVWVEAVGAPLVFALNLAESCESPVLMWMSASDPARTLRVKNNSRSALTVHGYVLTENEHEQDLLPFRLYLRLFDVLPATCACAAACQFEKWQKCDGHVKKVEEEYFKNYHLSNDIMDQFIIRLRDDNSDNESDSRHTDSDSSSAESIFSEESDDSQISVYEQEMDTGIEIFLASDNGHQEEAFFKISPESIAVAPGCWAEWNVSLMVPPRAEGAPPSTLLLRPLPVLTHGEGWLRPDPSPQVVRLRQTTRQARLKASVREVRVRLCALDLPFKDVLRVRKRFRIQNVGCGPLHITSRTEAPWSLVVRDEDAPRCSADCRCGTDAERHRECQVPLYLLPRSSMEMCVEARVNTEDSWPQPTELAEQAKPAEQAGPSAQSYEQRRRSVTNLRFYDTNNILLSLPMHLELEYPIISIEPAIIDFGFVTDGDTRKSYFTVSHSSRTATVDMLTEWAGGKEFRLWPRDFSLQPGGRERIYIQYTARWCGAPAEGCVRVAAACGARGWCRAAARARGTPARDADKKLHAHDHTDDTHLLPNYLYV